MRATTPPLNLRRVDGLVGSRAASTHQQLQQLHVDTSSLSSSASTVAYAPQSRLVTPQLVLDGLGGSESSTALPMQQQQHQRSAIIGPSRNYSLPQQTYNQQPQQSYNNQPPHVPQTVPLQVPQQSAAYGIPAKMQQQPQELYQSGGGMYGDDMQRGAGRPSQDFISSTINQWNSKMQQESLAMAQLDQEEALLAAEETALRAKIAELEEWRTQLDKEQLAVNHGWSTLYEMEERYYTEPIANRSHEIAEAEYKCAVLQERFNEAQLQLDMISRQLQAFAYVADRKKEQTASLERLANGFEQLERRRAAAVARAEQLFDVEAQRERKCSSLIQTLDTEIRTITVTAGLTAPQSSSAIHSNRQSLQPQRSRVVSFDQTPETILVQRETAPGLDCDSVCFGLDDDALGDASVAYSVCNLKKPRMEPALVR